MSWSTAAIASIVVLSAFGHGPTLQDYIDATLLSGVLLSGFIFTSSVFLIFSKGISAIA